MYDREEITHLIQAYTRGNLSKVQTQEFKEYLKQHPELQLDIEKEEFYIATNSLELDKLRSNMQQWKKEVLTDTSKVIHRRKETTINKTWIMGLAAMCLLFIGTYFVIYQMTPQPILVERYLSPYDFDLKNATRNNIEVLLNDAAAAYQKGLQSWEDKDKKNATIQLKKARLLWQNYLDKKPNTSQQQKDEILFYQAVTLICEGDSKTAAQMLYPLSQKKNFVYQEAAQWYLALSQPSSSKSILENLSKEGKEFKEQSKELLYLLN